LLFLLMRGFAQVRIILRWQGYKMKIAAQLIVYAFLTGGLVFGFQNCQGSGQNLPSAVEMASNATSIAGGTASAGGGSGQWRCTAHGSSVHVDTFGNRDANPISTGAFGTDQEVTSSVALDACNDIMKNQIANPDGNEYENEPCQVNDCHTL
jgi:hypothetical protein